MLYPERDVNGGIIAIRKTKETDMPEKEELTVSDLTEFLSGPGGSERFINLLTLTDSGMIRIIEDLIDVLVEKNIIMLTDLPEDARRKLFERSLVREKMHEQSLIVDDIL
jgi:hypothetical protein